MPPRPLPVFHVFGLDLKYLDIWQKIATMVFLLTPPPTMWRETYSVCWKLKSDKITVLGNLVGLSVCIATFDTLNSSSYGFVLGATLLFSES